MSEDRRVSRIESWMSARVLLFAGIGALIFFAGSIVRDISRPLWFDEACTRFISRLGSPAVIWRSLIGGPDIQPFSFFLITHQSLRLFGDGAFALRIPETIGYAVMCVSIYLFTLRRANRLCAFGAALLPFATGAGFYAIEGRPYGMELGFCGIMLVSWQAAAEHRHRKLALAGLACGAAGAVAVHFLAPLLLIPIGLGELERARVKRQLDPAIAIALLIGLIPEIAMIPLVRSQRAFAGAFWASPSWIRFEGCYQIIAVPGLACLAAAALLWLRRRPISTAATDRALPRYELITLLGFLCLPLILLAISPITHVLFYRYVLGIVFGPCILCGILLYRLRRIWPSVAIAFSVVMFAVLAAREVRDYSRPGPGNDLTADSVLNATATQGLPVVLSSSHVFLATEGQPNHPPDPRLWYLADRQESIRVFGFDSDDIALLNLRPLAPIQVAGPRDFVTSHPSFLFAVERGENNWVLQWVREQGGAVHAEPDQGPFRLFRVDMK